MRKKTHIYRVTFQTQRGELIDWAIDLIAYNQKDAKDSARLFWNAKKKGYQFYMEAKRIDNVEYPKYKIMDRRRKPW